LYNDYRNTGRESWKFTYLGSELLPFAVRKRSELELREREVRSKLSKAIADERQSLTSSDISDLKEQAETVGSEKEKLDIWVHEFKRCPTKEYTLQLGDVSFFDLTTVLSEQF